MRFCGGVSIAQMALWLASLIDQRFTDSWTVLTRFQWMPDPFTAPILVFDIEDAVRLAILAGFLWSAARISTAHAFLLVALSQHELVIYGGVAAVLVLTHPAPGADVLASAPLTVLASVGLNLLLLWALVRYPIEAPSSGVLAGLLAAGLAESLLGRLSLLSVTTWPLAQGQVPGQAIVIGMEYVGPAMLRSVLAFLPALVMCGVVVALRGRVGRRAGPRA